MRHALAAFALITAAFAPVAAQAPTADRLADSVRVAIEAAVDAGDPVATAGAVALADRALAAFPEAAILLHYKAYALYRAGTAVLGRGDLEQARQDFEQARAILEPLVRRETIPESYALLSSVYGMQIGLSRVPLVAGMQLGPKSSTWMDKAEAAGPGNPRVWVLKGIGAVNTPGAFGGGLDKAESHLRHALALLADDHPAPPLPAWGRADAHIWLGQVYAKRGRKDLARAQYDSALALQPRNEWITRGLIPALEKKP
jgi:tetratricopeptide (TPR) repeat protein